MTVQNTFQRLKSDLATIYDEREAGTIADWTMEKITGWKKMHRTINKQVALSTSQQKQLSAYTKELMQNRPVQYVLQEAWFCGVCFYVNENVLIPRPETEELVSWIAEENRNTSRKILDIGTGSGCIAISLKNKLPHSDVFACDISKPALEVASANAKENRMDVLFTHCDILDDISAGKLPYVDIIVSNPPYIPASKKGTMGKNVVDFEPQLALFVSDDDPLLFYKKIADLALKRLNENGTLYFEIHESTGKEVTELLKEKGFNRVELKHDMQGKDRMIKASY